MKKVCLMFPGQGSQAVGMGRDLYDRYPKDKEIFDLAGDELKTVIFDGPQETLKMTKWTQAAIFTVSIAAFEVFRGAIDISEFDFVAAGHSLGEYSALCAAGFFGFQDGLNMVKARGEFLQAASEKNKGTMAAVLGMDRVRVEDICKEAAGSGVCEPVNFNCPGQIVISGTTEGIKKAVDLISAAGGKSIALNVSGAFHSSLMEPACGQMSRELDKYDFAGAKFPVYTNCDAEKTADAAGLKGKLVEQINHAVKWDESIGKIIKEGFDTFIEIGPGRVLCGLLRKIDRSVKALNIEDLASFEKTLAEINKL